MGSTLSSPIGLTSICSFGGFWSQFDLSVNQTFVDNDQQFPLFTLTLVHFVLVSIHSDGGFIYLAGQQSRQQEANHIVCIYPS